MKSIKYLRLHPEDFFDSDHIINDLASKSARGGTITLVSQGVLFVLTFFRIVILARLLTPEDFGIVGMVAVTVGFAAIFKDAGLSIATIQKDNVTLEQISNLFWINLLVSLFLAIVICAIAPLVATFYERPELTEVTAAFSFSFFIQGITVQHDALLHRNMRFMALGLTNVASSCIALLVAITLALYGWNYWALIVSMITFSLISLLITFFFCPWIPGKPRKQTELRSIIRFGSHITVFNFFNYFSRNGDDILIGKFIDADALGLYANAYRIVQLPIQFLRGPITKVTIPACSRIHENNQQIRSYARKYSFILAFFGMPLMMLVFLLSKDAIVLVLGEPWLPMDPMLKLFALVGFIQTPANVKGMMLLSCGRSREYMYQGIGVAVITILSFVIGLQWGAVGIAASYTISVYLIQLPTLYYASRFTPLNIVDFLDSIYHPAFASIISGILLLWFSSAFSFHSEIIKLLVMIPFFLIAYMLSFIIFPRGIELLRYDLMATFRKGFMK